MLRIHPAPQHWLLQVFVRLWTSPGWSWQSLSVLLSPLNTNSSFMAKHEPLGVRVLCTSVAAVSWCSTAGLMQRQACLEVRLVYVGF